MKTIFRRIIKDIKQWYVVIIAIIIYSVIVKFVFDAFCPFLIFSGIPCAGCGMTRAVYHIVAGDIKKGLELNPVAPLWMLLGLYCVWIRYIKGNKIKELSLLLGIAGVITFGVYIYRMVVYFPDTPPLIYFEDNILIKIFKMCFNA